MPGNEGQWLQEAGSKSAHQAHDISNVVFTLDPGSGKNVCLPGSTLLRKHAEDSMSQRLPTSFRNPRKHFLKCVDCGRQTLPQNASRDRPWSAAASLHVAGRINEGALCFSCANRRSALLGLPVEQNDTYSTSDCVRPVSGSANDSRPKRIRINDLEYTFKVTTLQALIEEWKRQYFFQEYKQLDSRWWRVFVNQKCIPADIFASVAICDGDNVSIVMGRGRLTGRKRRE
jgi:hypothetical protein